MSNEVNYEVVSKETGEVVAYNTRGFNENNELFVVLESGEEITFSKDGFDNDFYVMREVGTGMSPDGVTVADEVTAENNPEVTL